MIGAACLLAFGAFGTALACNQSLPDPLADTPPVAVVDARISNTTCVAPRPPRGMASLDVAYTGLAAPLDMVARPGIFYIAEMKGRVKAIDLATGNVRIVLDLIGKVGTLGDQGLLGLAIHPTKPFAYVVVERDPDATTIPDKPNRSEILRFAINADGTFDPASETLLLRLDRPLAEHYAGTLKFGPDGYLYIGVGDGGRNYPANVLAYDPTQLLGSVLRIDIDHTNGATPYAVPPDNPFVNGGGAPEIFAGGFRNPWRFSIDSQTGEIWGGDVGENTYEEVNKIEKGKNYGWPTFEGPICFKPAVDCSPAGLTPPVYSYKHEDGASVTGGFIYRGKGMPKLSGMYIFADYRVGRIVYLDPAHPELGVTVLNPGGPSPGVSGFGEDLDHELYVLGWDTGTIFKLVAAEPDLTPTLPALLSQSGCVNPQDPTKPAPGVVPFDVNVQLWSDGADKSRFFAMPDGMQMTVGPDGDFFLPNGSVTMKTFAVGGKPVETRLMFRYATGTWTGASYEWNDAGTDATRLEQGKEKLLASGQTWTFPSPNQCFICHTIGSGTTLGLEAIQLNRDREWATGQIENQLTRLSALGYLATPLDPLKTNRLPELTGAAPVEDRARAYLHANCASCHRPESNVGASIDLLFNGVTHTDIGGCQTTVFNGRTDISIITPGDPSRSALYLHMSSRDSSLQMPPLGTLLVDPTGTEAVATWIKSSTTCAPPSP